MQLYLLRHGIAEEAGPGMDDDDRRLTPLGKERMRAEAEALKRLRLRVDLILTSPLVRAWQTARIVGEALGTEPQRDPRLVDGPSIGVLQQIVTDHPGVERLMLVGHNPGLPFLAGELAGEASLDLKKGGLIRVDLDYAEPGRGMLMWLIPPSALIGLAEA